MTVTSLQVESKGDQYTPAADPHATIERREIPLSEAGKRLDSVLAALWPEHSRARLQAWLREGHIHIDGSARRPKDKVLGGEQVQLAKPAPTHTPDQRAQPIELKIVYEDETLFVIDKPIGLVVHPAAGNPDGTLLNALLHRDPALEALPRAGIVHRLDKNTSGLMVVARTPEAHTDLVRQLQARSVGREYLALVQGEVTAGGTVDAPIGRHPIERKRMSVHEGGKEAISHYRIEQRLRGYTLLRVHLETGRTHQIRVHMQHIRFPIVGDPVYGGRLRLAAGLSEPQREALQRFRRQALHATRLHLQHPLEGIPMHWDSPMPHDMTQLLHHLEATP